MTDPVQGISSAPRESTFAETKVSDSRAWYDTPATASLRDSLSGNPSYADTLSILAITAPRINTWLDHCDIVGDATAELAAQYAYESLVSVCDLTKVAGDGAPFLEVVRATKRLRGLLYVKAA